MMPRARSRAVARSPLLYAGWPQQVCARGHFTWQPASSSRRMAAKPTVGRYRSTRQVTNSATRVSGRTWRRFLRASAVFRLSSTRPSAILIIRATTLPHRHGRAWTRPSVAARCCTDGRVKPGHDRERPHGLAKMPIAACCGTATTVSPRSASPRQPHWCRRMRKRWLMAPGSDAPRVTGRHGQGRIRDRVPRC